MAADRRRKLSVSAAENKPEIDRALVCNDRVELLLSTGACCSPTVAGREAARATDELCEEPEPDEAGKSYGVQRCIQHCVQRCFRHCVGSSYVGAGILARAGWCRAVGSSSSAPV